MRFFHFFRWIEAVEKRSSMMTDCEENEKRDGFRGSPTVPPGNTNCPGNYNSLSLNVIRVMVVHGHVGGQKMWSYLAKNWADYGTVQLQVLSVVHFTLDDLQMENPDIIVCSDVAGSPYQLSSTEMNALKKFISETSGKKLLGTYATLYHQEGLQPSIYDNRALAPLFGFREDIEYRTRKIEKDEINPMVC